MLRFVASTFDPLANRVVPGIGRAADRESSISHRCWCWEQFPLNKIVQGAADSGRRADGTKVEIEFAATTFEQTPNEPAKLRLGFLQVRPMAVSTEVVEVSLDDLTRSARHRRCRHGDGQRRRSTISTTSFSFGRKTSPSMRTPEIAQELDAINRQAARSEHRPYVLIGFGRWGSSHPSLGIPVDWSQISGARDDRGGHASGHERGAEPGLALLP